MDKNTLNGLLMMLAVFLIFMWLQPKHTDSDSNTESERTSQGTPVAALADSLSPTEHEWLVKNIVDNGVPETLSDSTRAYRLTQGPVNLTLAGDSIWGTVEVDGDKLAWGDITRGDIKKVGIDRQRKAIAAVKAMSESLGRYGKFSKFLGSSDSKVLLENDVLKLELSAKSGSITRAELKKYDTEYSSDETEKRKEKVVIFEGDRNRFNFQLPLPQPVETADLCFTPRQLNDSTVLMALDMGDGAYWGMEYTLPKGESYVVRLRIVQNAMADIVQSNARNLGLDWQQDLHRQEKGKMFEERNSGIYYKFAGGSVEHLSESKNDSEERQSKVRWIAFKNQFFSTVMIADRPFNTADFSSEIIKGQDYLKSMTAAAVVNDYDWNSGNPVNFHLFIGPNLYPLLSHLDKEVEAGEDLKMTKLIPLGWSLFRWINTGVIIPVFTFLGKFISNYGIIILLLTIFIKLVLFPLTYKSYKSQAKMRVLAPDIKAINDKYPGAENAMIRQQKTMALYSKAGASPMSGCLPMLLQMPILFAMFSFFPSCIELRGQSFLWAHDLSAPDAIISWSGNIPFITEYFGNHISLFCLLMTATNIIYTYINMQNQPSTMPGMKWMMYLMPLFFLVFFNNYAAGLSYYYFLSLLITIIQTYAFRYIIKEEDVRKAMAEASKKPRKKSGFMARLEEMQRQQQAMLREQQKQQQRGGKR
ncbi:membrane protein insertase YidC [Sangeribacter muris]|jgi:YidC/Oxa1 family membrane protein insertase|uniref:membrane protein insertase YidC n=1 Tax=Sangeribacter muris TaxID=2880703 RepID=UPI000F51AADC|nr:membrane protein insertase YidC [Sangeribacter muris]ROS85710.1 membrane protein insertase YidC [Muribaculaceae bacterium Isolate-036 (Harlan)]